MPFRPALLAPTVTAVLAGCGSYVPDMAPPEQYQLFVEDVHLSLRCELIDAVHDTLGLAAENPGLQHRTASFFETWGVKYTLTLQVAENFSFDASLSGTSEITPQPGDRVFTIGTGIGKSARATRTETDQSFNTLKLYANEKRCERDKGNKIVPHGSDLGLGSWFRTRLSLVERNIIGSITERESFTYRVQFDIASTGRLTPTWTFVQRKLSSAGTPFSGGRSTAHSVLVTLGPTSEDRAKLAEEAAAVHDANIIGAFVNQ